VASELSLFTFHGICFCVQVEVLNVLLTYIEFNKLLSSKSYKIQKLVSELNV
jgi:hypothetical protein